MIATRQDTTLKYVHQDSLNSTSVVTANDGSLVSSIKYFPFGATRSGSVSMAIQFTGQRLDSTGLYYYGARYYDPVIGKFASPDTASPDLMNPQSLNKYSYCFNNALKYNDPTGHWPNWSKIGKALSNGLQTAVDVIKADPLGAIQTVLDIAGMVPVIGEVCDAASGVISLVKGDAVGAALSFASCVPGVGNITGAAKIGLAALKITDKVKDVASVGKGAENAIGAYKDVKKAVKASGEKLEVHHIVEKRFARDLDKKPNDMLSIALTKDDHRKFTNAWRELIPYGTSADANAGEIWDAAQKIYKDDPDLLEAARITIFGE